MVSTRRRSYKEGDLPADAPADGPARSTRARTASVTSDSESEAGGEIRSRRVRRSSSETSVPASPGPTASHTPRKSLLARYRTDEQNRRLPAVTEEAREQQPLTTTTVSGERDSKTSHTTAPVEQRDDVATARSSSHLPGDDATDSAAHQSAARTEEGTGLVKDATGKEVERRAPEGACDAVPDRGSTARGVGTGAASGLPSPPHHSEGHADPEHDGAIKTDANPSSEETSQMLQQAVAQEDATVEMADLTSEAHANTNEEPAGAADVSSVEGVETMVVNTESVNSDREGVEPMAVNTESVNGDREGVESMAVNTESVNSDREGVDPMAVNTESVNGDTEGVEAITVNTESLNGDREVSAAASAATRSADKAADIQKILSTIPPQMSGSAPVGASCVAAPKLTRIRPEPVPRGKPKSGRFWKPVHTKMERSIVRVRESYDVRMKKAQQQKVVKDLERQMKSEHKEKMEDLRKRREYNKKKAEENALKSEVYQVLKNPNKIKRMKKKQLRQLTTRDTTVVGQSVLDG